MFHLTRRMLAALAFAAFVPTALPATNAVAEPLAQITTQAPGYFRFALGDMTVTALYDGYVDLKTNLLKGATPQTIDTLLAKMFAPKGVQTAVNAFLIHTGTRLILVDTGTAKAFGPQLGFVVANLQAAGYDPAQVDEVLLTHLHPDHANGLLTVDGKAAFPNATIRAAKAEADHWLSEDIAAKAPESARPFYSMARAAIAPYAAAGRFHPFQPADTVAPGIVSVAAQGHTPGHSGFLLTSQGNSLLIWGDIIHNHAVQFARPDVSIEFDSDQAQAIATRKRIMAQVAREKLWVAGAHMPFPGIGHVQADGTGYRWIPVEYGPLR